MVSYPCCLAILAIFSHPSMPCGKSTRCSGMLSGVLNIHTSWLVLAWWLMFWYLSWHHCPRKCLVTFSCQVVLVGSHLVRHIIRLCRLMRCVYSMVVLNIMSRLAMMHVCWG